MANDPQTEEAQQAILLAQHAREVNDIIEIGHTHYGRAQFDEASAAVAAGLGNKAQQFMAQVRGFDKPHEIVTHLADNPSRLEALAKLSPEQMGTEIARIEAQMSPHGRPAFGADPAWKNPAVKSGRVSDMDWKTTGGANLSDAQWHAEYDRRQEQRNKRR
jgi:hypothetical protein